ncbi:unnamed protein product [Ixodes pacificus]
MFPTGLNGAACLAACCSCMLMFFTFLIPYQFCSMQCKVLHFKLVVDESCFCMKISQAVFFCFFYSLNWLQLQSKSFSHLPSSCLWNIALCLTLSTATAFPTVFYAFFHSFFT